MNHGRQINGWNSLPLKRHSNSVIESYFNVVKMNLQKDPDIVVPG